jgi:insulysin
MSDPADTQGIAHFLEHMLFMGTEKFPDENEYSKYLNAHGGSSNAYTDSEDTVYYFDVNQEHLQGALDRFAQFFISPLFTEGATGREMNAVDAENAKNQQTDVWRLMQLKKSLARPDHPYHNFGTGNLETLKALPEKNGINLRERLLKFHADHYSANLMRLVVSSSSKGSTASMFMSQKQSPQNCAEKNDGWCDGEAFSRVVL